ncbi:uncharacterized protein F4812DRAFT_459038 [Daldinia caldariorum]|uniref:uncharacterized protein n=1 Tax=Daldinia caldariorum TaxID=326644 RepID=UPI00200810DD|nr:uncharacterized protein F4812DRAFT_459038 [Daldinia caldariorum]KAI1467749.1 hypothetical protein F4812DRAFT_459038 [Daldinia caldariorum]
MKPITTLAATLASVGFVRAHVAAFTKGMYCLNGTQPGVEDLNTNTVVNPLFQLPKNQWWMQHDRGCDSEQVAPSPGDFLDLPAGGSFTVELASNRAQSSLSYDGKFTSEWPDGKDHPEDWHSPSPDTCLNANPDKLGGAMHTHNESTAAGTAFAISYNSDLSKVTMENLVVFTLLEHTPWKRIATYQVPQDMPPCPEGGCYCAWLWVPDGCGEPNMYMQNFKCRVTGSTSNRTLAPAKPPVYCADGTTPCVPGAKQMIAWNQAEGNNVETPAGVSPGYNQKMGWQPGAQNDIFQ